MVTEEEKPEVEVPVLSVDGCCFKTPQKRKMVECRRQGKRTDSFGISQTDTDSESDISECSFSASLPLCRGAGTGGAEGAAAPVGNCKLL